MRRKKRKKETQLWERLFHLYRCKLGWPRPHSSVAKQRRQTTIFPTPKQDFTAQEMNQRKQTSFTEVTPQISTVLKSRAAMIQLILAVKCRENRTTHTQKNYCKSEMQIPFTTMEFVETFYTQKALGHLENNDYFSSDLRSNTRKHKHIYCLPKKI